MWSMSETTRNQPPVAMTVAGSEATGGAGALADIKTFTSLGVFGSLALTCIVAFDPENEWGHRVTPVDQQTLANQLQTITAAYDLDAVKIGMLGHPDTIRTVATAMRELKPRHLVLDPVLICKGQEPGAALDTDQALKAEVLPLATFVTPNHFESLSLSGLEGLGIWSPPGYPGREDLNVPHGSRGAANFLYFRPLTLAARRLAA